MVAHPDVVGEDTGASIMYRLMSGRGFYIGASVLVEEVAEVCKVITVVIDITVIRLTT
jgi:ABC-type antimicrobial peptide transport system permease subunit